MKHSRNQEKGVQNPSSVTRRKPSGSRAAMLPQAAASVEDDGDRHH